MGTSKQLGKGLRQTEPGPPGPTPAKAVQYRMRLYVAGDEPNSATARTIIYEICMKYFNGNYELEIVDVFENFIAAVEDRILVTPCLVIDKPKKAVIYGNLRDRNAVLEALGLI